MIATLSYCAATEGQRRVGDQQFSVQTRSWKAGAYFDAVLHRSLDCRPEVAHRRPCRLLGCLPADYLELLSLLQLSFEDHANTCSLSDVNDQYPSSESRQASSHLPRR